MAPAAMTKTNGTDEATAATLKQMRKGTKSCMECRRRKIKCNYPPTPPASPSATTATDPTQSPEKKCIECTTYRRTCQIQGYVAPMSTSARDAQTAHLRIDGEDAPIPKTTQQVKKPRIYKRRRPADQDSPEASDGDERPRMKMHIDRMPAVVERIAKEQRAGSSQADWDYPLSGSLQAPVNMSDGSEEFDLSHGSAFAQVLGLDLAPTNVFGAPSNGLGDGLDTFTFPELSNSSNARLVTSTSANTPISAQPRREAYKSTPVSAGGLDLSLPTEEQHKSKSPLLCQLFNNEVFTQATTTPQVLVEKVQSMSFSDLNKNATDAEKLRSTITSEPYLLEVLDISTKWWIAWRDQAFALQDVFAFTPRDQSRQNGDSRSDTGSSNGEVPSLTSSKSSPTSGSGMSFTGEKPVSLRDFVLMKLGQADVISISTGIMCVALSLSQLRPGLDDSLLNISTTASEIADRITLAVDAIVLSPPSKPEYMRNPGVLLLLMMRAKMFAESNQLRKSWLSVRKTINQAKAIGFAEFVAGESAVQLSPSEMSKVFHRQRFIGSIMEMDRLMSMVLGFPHAEDVKFTDRLAMTVLRGQIPADTMGSKPHVPGDIRMRALRRVVSIVAGRVNDRNASDMSTVTEAASLQATMAIQETLNEAAAAMTNGWWDVASHLHYTDPFVAHEHLVAQMWFWQTQAFLHLPFLLKTCHDMNSPEQYPSKEDMKDPYVLNRFLCLQGCRGMIRVFSLLRSDPALAVYICACEDFQGVFSACILMVGTLIRLAFLQALPGSTDHLGGSIESDLALINDIKDVFRYRALQQGGCISKQGMKVLEELETFLDEDHGRFDAKPMRRTVVLPYFGAIHLELTPPRHLLDRYSKVDTLGPFTIRDPTPPSSTAQSLDGGFELGGLDMTVMPNFSGDNMQVVVPEGNLNWDQFLFGNELLQDWEAQIPQWPTDESLWEWT